jgi:tetratricopeptide (TPR) repeat protein
MRKQSVDPRAALGRGLTLFAHGALDEAASAFEQAIELNHDCALAHLALGRLRLHQNRLEDAADSLQMAVLYDPDSAESHADLALVLARQGLRDAAFQEAQIASAGADAAANIWAQCARAYKILNDYQHAATCYEAALRHEPCADFACQLGYVRFLGGAYDAGRAAYERALALDPAHAPTLHNSGLLELETGFPLRALECFERAQTLRPSPESLACVGHALRDLGRPDEACKVYRQVLAVNPCFADARINLGYALLMRGEFEAGWAQYEYRFGANGAVARDFGLPQWRGEPLAERRLLIYAEQGLGDEIMFASCIPDAIACAAGCVIECNTRLASLFARSFPKARVHGGEKSDKPEWLSQLPACDYQIPIGDLPGQFRAAAASFARHEPYLVADAARIEYWRRRIPTDQRVNVGIAWRGGVLRSRQFLRSIPLAQWSSLLRMPECRFVALQHGGHSAELEQVCANQNISVDDLSGVCTDMDELAALVCALDLIISVDNTLVHLAGALGVPAWALLPAAPEWRYMRSGEQMPWYRSVRLFRQRSSREWNSVFGEVATALSRGEGKALRGHT